MAVRIRFKVNDVEFNQTIRARGEQWAKALDHTLSDMKGRAPTVVAKETKTQYSIKQANLNPKKNKNAGDLHLSGGLKNFTMVYDGAALPVSDFSLRPRGWSEGRHKIFATILSKKKTIIGHFAPPRSEGGRYGAVSPHMYVPGHNYKYGPTKRTGRTFGETVRGPAVPQMVINAETRYSADITGQLNELMAKRLAHNLGRLV